MHCTFTFAEKHAREMLRYLQIRDPAAHESGMKEVRKLGLFQFSKALKLIGLFLILSAGIGLLLADWVGSVVTFGVGLLFVYAGMKQRQRVMADLASQVYADLVGERSCFTTVTGKFVVESSQLCRFADLNTYQHVRTQGDIAVVEFDAFYTVVPVTCLDELAQAAARHVPDNI